MELFGLDPLSPSYKIVFFFLKNHRYCSSIVGLINALCFSATLIPVVLQIKRHVFNHAQTVNCSWNWWKLEPACHQHLLYVCIKDEDEYVYSTIVLHWPHETLWLYIIQSGFFNSLWITFSCNPLRKLMVPLMFYMVTKIIPRGWWCQRYSFSRFECVISKLVTAVALENWENFATVNCAIVA